MGSADIGAGGQGLLAHNSQHNALTTVIQVKLVARLSVHARLRLHKATGLSSRNGPGGGLTLGLGSVHESHVATAVGFHFSLLLSGDTGKAVLIGVQQRIAQFFGSHRDRPPYHIAVIAQRRNDT